MTSYRKLVALILGTTLIFAQDPNNPSPGPCCLCGGNSNPMDTPVPRSEGSGCGETEEVGVNDDGTLNIQTEPIPPGCNWQISIKDADGKPVTLPVTKDMVKLPIRVEYRCTGASESEPPCKVKCYTCSEASCGSGSCSDPGDGGTGKETVQNKCVYVRIPVGFRRFGDYTTYLRLELPENSIANPGPSALKISSGFGYSHNMNNNGTPTDPSDDFVAAITCQFGYASVAKSPTVGDSNAFTVSLRTSSTASVHRTILFENTGSSFRVSSTYMGKTIITDWHPKSGTSDTFTMDEGYLNGSTFEVLRSVDKIVSQPDLGTYVIRMKVYERASNAASGTMPNILVSDREVTYVKYSWSWQIVKRVIDPDGAKLTTTYEYYQSGEMTGPSSYAGVGQLKSLKSYDGHEELHIYDDYSHTIYTPFKGVVNGTETMVAWNGTFTERTYTRKIQGTLVEKNVTTYNPTLLTYTSKDYSSATDFLTTTYEYYPVAAYNSNSALLKRIINPDDTATLYNNTETSFARTTEIKSGAYNSGTQTITQGTQQTTISGIHGAMEVSITTAIGTGSGTVLSHSLVHSADVYGRALTTHHFPVSGTPAYTTSATYDCCGMSSSTDKYGITTYYMRDNLGRLIKTNHLGVTQETLFNGLTTHSLRYDQSPPLFATSSSSTSHEVARSVSNLAGTVQESWSRSPQTGAMVKMSTTTSTYRNPVAISGNSNPNGLAANVGYTTSEQLIQVADDESVTPAQTSIYYLDGNLWESSGDLAPAMRYSYLVNSTGPLNGQAYLDGTVEKEASTVQQDWLGRSLTETKGTMQNTKVYTGDKLTRSYDADGVDTFYFYNSEGNLTKTVLDLNGNNAAEDSIDQVTISESYPGTYTPPGGSATPVVTTVQKVIVSSTTQITAQTSHATPNGLQNWSLTVGTANPTYQLTSLGGSGNWTETTTMPDGTKSHQIYTAGRLQKSQQLTNESIPAVIAETTYTTYDAIGRSTVVTDKRTGASTTTYLNLYTDVVTSFIDSGSRTTSYSYDHRGRRTLVNQPDTGAIANETITKYLPDGKTKEVTGDQTYRSTYTYDYAGRMKTLVTYGTTTATTTWNYSTTTGQLTSKLDHTNKGPAYTYTNGGRLKTRTWERGNRTRYDYDPAGRLQAKRYFLTAAADTGSNTGNDPNTGDVTISYNRLSLPLTQVVACNTAINRPGVRVHSTLDSNNLRPLTFGLYLDPDQVTLSQNGAIPFTIGRVIHAKYDSLGRNAGFTLRENFSAISTLHAETTYRYSATNGRFAAVSSNPIGATSTTTHDFLYGYEANSNLVKTTQSFNNYNFTSNSGTAIHQATRAYESTRDVLDTITSINSSTSAVISGSDYAVNEIGQRTGITRSGSATPGSASAGYTYNSRGELVTADESTNAMDRAYQFDGIGNREKSANSLTLPGTKNYTVNALNQYTAVDLGTSVSPVHDDDGNATAYPLPVNLAANAALTYDGENRLIKVITGSTTVEYIYDALSRRVAKTVGSTRTYYIYDGWNCVAEFTGAVHTSGTAPALTRTFTHTWGLDLSGSIQGAGGVGGLLQTTAHGSPPTHHYPLYDGNGNITAYIDNACALQASFDYDPFGNITNSNNTPALPYAFSTKPRESETGLYYYGYRWYDPLTGRWPSRDPIEENGGMNLFVFNENSPTNSIDILGLNMAPGTDLTKPGPYAVKGIPTLRTSTYLPRHDAITFHIYGQQFGCHTCGIRNPGTKFGKWIRDHITPNCLRAPGQPSMLYPQCLKCSNRQGGFLRHGITRAFSVVGGVILWGACADVANADELHWRPGDTREEETVSWHAYNLIEGQCQFKMVTPAIPGGGCVKPCNYFIWSGKDIFIYSKNLGVESYQHIEGMPTPLGNLTLEIPCNAECPEYDAGKLAELHEKLKWQSFQNKTK